MTDSNDTPNTPPIESSTVVAAAPTEIAEYRYPLQFTGTASEYSRIWIVNLLLSIVTLGIFSAWAKVRNRKYLLGNTRLADVGFDYHADPIKILKGRIAIGILAGAYAFGAKISVAIPAIAILLFIGLFPWLLVRGSIFNLGNTSYRGLRFGFEKDYAGSYSAFYKGIAATIFSFGLAFPYARFLALKFRISRSRFGTEKFNFSGESGDVFVIYIRAIGMSILAGIGVGVLGFVGQKTIPSGNMVAAVIWVAGMYGIFFLWFVYIQAETAKFIGRSTKLGPIKFELKFSASELAALYLTNAIAIIFSLGLAIPWALLRAYKYRVTHTAVIAAPMDFEVFVAAAESSSGALADAAVDFWDIDLGF